MVTSYYIMKMLKKPNKFDNNSHYSDLLNKDLFSSKKIKNTCRVCLQRGKIPIYGENMEIAEVLVTFGDVQLSEHDDLPKHLCEVCFKFVETAILFRRTARQSDEVLRKPAEESIVENDEYHNESDDDEPPEVMSFQADPPVFADVDEFSHIKIEKKERVKYATKIPCDVCNKVINRSYYKEHMTMHNPNPHKYICEVCGKSFRLRCSYHNHRVRHRTDFPYKCQFCPYRGRYPELLKNHMRTHTGDYRYMCTECPARFLFKSNLNSHVRKHREPQFKCDACKRAFHSKLTLQRHFEADHLGVKNHVCSTCGKAFGYRNAMMKHQRHVHKREKLLFGRMPSYLVAQDKQQLL